MKFAAFLTTTLTAICLVIAPVFAALAPDLQAAGQAFLGTWESSRTNLCGPCMVKVDSIDPTGKVEGTITTNPDGTTPLNGSVAIEKGKVVLNIITPRGSAAYFELPKGNKMSLTFGNGRDIDFKRQ